MVSIPYPIPAVMNTVSISPLSVQIKSDKIFTGEVFYKLEGPGVDQEPKNLFEIDDKTGVIRSKRPLDREKYNSFTVSERLRVSCQIARTSEPRRKVQPTHEGHFWWCA